MPPRQRQPRRHHGAGGGKPRTKAYPFIDRKPDLALDRQRDPAGQHLIHIATVMGKRQPFGGSGCRCMKLGPGSGVAVPDQFHQARVLAHRKPVAGIEIGIIVRGMNNRQQRHGFLCPGLRQSSIGSVAAFRPLPIHQNH
jgi:hypothetical protein